MSYSVDNLPAEMHYLLTELKNKDLELQELLAKISNRQHKMFVRGSLSNGDYNTTASTEELALRDKIKRDLKRADQLAEEKCALADRAKELLDRHLTRLDQDLESLYPQHNLIPAATISSSRSSSPGTQASPLSKRQAQAAGLTTSSAAAAASGSLTPGSTGPGGPGGAYQTPYNGRGRTPQASLKRPRTTNSNSPGRPPRLPPTGALNTPTASLSASSRTGTGPVVCGANNIKLSDPNTTLEFIQVAVEDALAAAAGNAATHLGPLGVGVVGEEGVHIGEHIEDEERYCYCHNISNGVMIGCDNEVRELEEEVEVSRARLCVF
ncbi:inhibitor of growth proteins N-terminal histone-binding-domain-containing protein [Jimgerdemannia flammicorona]|uniref:Inhibitor of growth proteins N-terminal histone-binding-domain-containing protein n=1 Tax=Jimgerdemannia flammicorona TaxID=994334 RepID=A0A433QND7_9FUNG|nr:inhibitor of growth proteins N-terminal histone-binding-domain-containing protein [Jimgerdemannia flammicorona]